MELVTAVISGDRSLELRLFAGEFLSVQEELTLTHGLCQLMNRAESSWKRLSTLVYYVVSLFSFQIEACLY